MAYTVYILRSQSNGGIYIGQTADLARRLAQHNDPSYTLTMHTKRRTGPWVLIYREEFSTRREAVRRERALKSGQGRQWIQQHLLRQSVPPIG